MTLSDERIRDLAQAMRTALERAAPMRLPVTLRGFPKGACGDSELLVAKLLEGHGHPPFDYMLGSRDGWSHAWLQQGDLIVDITGDQFVDHAPAVTVTRGSAWHAAFNGQRLHVADFAIYGARARHELASAYSYLSSLLPADLRLSEQITSSGATPPKVNAAV
jgi:hypothetical protein